MMKQEDIIKQINRFGKIVGADRLLSSVDGTSKMKKNNIWNVQLSFDADQCIKKPKFIPMRDNDFKLIPIIIWIEPNQEGDN